VHPSEPPPPEPVSTTNLVATVAASEGRRQPQVADASNTTGTGEQQNKQASLLATRF
jgi:hypothetical protein